MMMGIIVRCEGAANIDTEIAPMVDIITPKTPIKARQKRVSFKVDAELFEALEALKSRVKSYHKKVDFNLDSVLEEALKRNIAAAHRQLDSLDESGER